MDNELEHRQILGTISHHEVAQRSAKVVNMPDDQEPMVRIGLQGYRVMGLRV